MNGNYFEGIKQGYWAVCIDGSEMYIHFLLVMVENIMKKVLKLEIGEILIK
jgi:hypothetical protein